MFINMFCAAQYYFSSNSEQEGEAKVLLATKTSILRHSGSIALGSMIHAIVMILKALIDAATRAESESGDGVNACLLKCVQCCCHCIESLIEYLNKSAYAMCAISGDPYCRSAWNGYMMVLKHLYPF